MTYKWIFAILKIEKLKIFLSAVKRIGQMLKVTGTVNSKTGTRVSTIENNNSLKITFLKRLLSTAKCNCLPRFTKFRRVNETGFLSKICGKMFSVFIKRSYDP